MDEAGNILATENVKEGEDVKFVAPTISGKTFVAYSLSEKYVTCDMVLVAIYK